MATSNFSLLDNTKVLIGGRWQHNATQLISQGANGDIRFSWTGTELKMNHAAGGTAAFEASVDGGSFALVTTTSTASKTLVTIATGLSEATHTVVIRLNTGYTNGGLKFWLADGIEVTGAAPAISAYPDADTTGQQHLLWSDSRLQNNFAAQLTSFTNPGNPSTGGASLVNGRIRFKTDGAKLWIWSPAGSRQSGRVYIDGFAEQEFNDFAPTSSITPTFGWLTFDLPNDGQMHEIMVVGKTGFDQIMVAGGTGIFESAYQRGCLQSKVVNLGDSVTSADSATGYRNASVGLDVLTELALPGRFTFYNRGISGQSVTTFLSNGRDLTELQTVSPNVIICWMGVNDLSGLTTQPAEDAKRDEYIEMYTRILRNCPKAKLYQMGLIGFKAVATLTRLYAAQQAAVTSVAAAFPTRTIEFIATDASWDTGPDTPTAGFTRASDHPFPSGYMHLAGYGHAVVVLSAQPSGGDSVTMTIGGTSRAFTFDAGAHGGSPNPVTIGADVAATITNLKNVMLSVLGRPNLVAWTNNSSAGYAIGVRNCTAISDSGSNVFTYQQTVDGWIDLIEPLMPPPIPSEGGSAARLLLGVG